MRPTFLHRLKEKVIIFDGATGTHLQGQNLSPDDFGGDHLAGCNEHLVFSKPSAVEQVHADYLEAGVDVVETNSFGGTGIVLAEYGLAAKSYDLNREAARIARRVADQFSTDAHPRFVAGSIGPGTKLPSLGHILFTDLSDAFSEQTRGLIDGGVDLLCIETCQDILQTKAALHGVFQTFRDLRKKVPVVVSVTMESTGTMLLGTELSAAITTIEPYDIDVFGINCATGPKEMSGHVRTLFDSSPFPVFVMPNAGMPENVGGHAHYSLSPEEYVRFMTHFVRDLGVHVAGGCCGTTKEHMRQLVQAIGSEAPKPRKPALEPSASSLYAAAPFSVDNPPVLVAERTNANGSKLFRDLLAIEDWEGIVAVGKEQEREQAHMMDVCAAYVGRNETADMIEIVSRFNRQITIPLVIDSTEVGVIEEALRRIGGKAIVNSINLEDGEDRLNRIVALCRAYGAAVIALTIDEKGMAKTADAKVAIAKRIYDLVVTRGGMKPHDLIFDTLTFTLGSGDEEFRRAGIETIEAIRRIKEALPGVHTILGVSNISFGLSPAARAPLNSVFLHEAVVAGLDMAIVHASRIMPLFKIEERVRELCRQLVLDERQYEGEGEQMGVTFDPLKGLLELSSTMKAQKSVAKVSSASVEERLKQRIIDGDKQGLNVDLDEALKRYPALEIINTFLLDGMKVVGDLFGSGQMQLPFVLQSAEVMKAAVRYLESFMEKEEDTSKGTLVIATVKGDVHDIGKNLVDIIVTNNGYRVINLGIKCPLETMLKAAEEHKADAIGMSGLLVKSTLVMKENLQLMKEQGLEIPVLLGGAALTRRFVEQDLRKLYEGPVLYANDAFDGLKLMQKIVQGEALPVGGDASKRSPEQEEEELTGQEAKIAMSQRTLSSTAVRKDIERPIPPFWGDKVVTSISLDEVFPYINEVALVRGQWRVVRGKLAKEEYESRLKENVYPELASLKKLCIDRSLLVPQVVYGYFPCASMGNDLIVYDPKSWKDGKKRIALERFSFPRQSGDRNLCIADYFLSANSDAVDVVGLSTVTVGRVASEYAKELYGADKYKDYLYFHGLSVETAEALAEYWHKQMRLELGIANEDAPEIKRLFSQGYRGSRFSFGYPACPNLEDQQKLFRLLNPERIGVTLSDEFQLDPEQSTTAIVVHHPDARYFTI